MTMDDLNKMLKDDFARPVVGCDNYYVTRDAKIISIIKHNGTCIRILKYGWVKGGYLTCNLYEGRKRRQLLVHRMVAQAFIPNPDNYPIINHKDENPSNNCVENLEWCTYKYNSNYGTCNQRRSKKVAQIDNHGNTVKIWNSIWEATRNGYVRSLVSDCANGKISTYRKFKWEFV